MVSKIIIRSETQDLQEGIKVKIEKAKTMWTYILMTYIASCAGVIGGFFTALREDIALTVLLSSFSITMSIVSMTFLAIHVFLAVAFHFEEEDGEDG